MLPVKKTISKLIKFVYKSLFADKWKH